MAGSTSPAAQFVPVRTSRSGAPGTQRLFPAISDNGEPRWLPGDTDVTVWNIVSIGWCHGSAANRRDSSDLRGRLYITDARAVAISDHFAKGSTYRAYGVGLSAIAAPLASKLSQARAQREAAGQYLNAQMCWPWMTGLIWARPSAKKGLRGELRFRSQTVDAFGEPESVMLIVKLAQPSAVEDVVRQVVRRVRRDREQWHRTSDQDRRALAAVADPAHVVAPEGQLPMISLPGGFRVSEASAAFGTRSALSYPSQDRQQ